MEGHGDSARPPSGGFIRLHAGSADLGSWLGPTWAMLCGVLASSAFRWQSGDWLPAALLILLVDAGWGTLWTALASTNWAVPMERWRSWDKNRATSTLPYTLPGAPGDRLSHWTGRLSTWWQGAVWPTCGPAIRAILIALPVTGLLGALLGPELLLLSGATLAVMQLGVIWEAGRGVVPPGWDGLVAITLPWLAGHVTFESVTVPSASLALFFALAWGSAWNVRSGQGRALLILSQLMSAVCLIVLRRPLVAGTLLLLLLPQMALLPWIRRELAMTQFVRYARPWLLAAMALAALAL